MAEIKDCIGKNVKISKSSITIKGDNNKTCGVVRNITSLYNMQPNKQMDIIARWKKMCLNREYLMQIGLDNIIIKDNNIYVFRKLQTIQHYEKYGFFDDSERQKWETLSAIYDEIEKAGIDIVECYF